MKKPWVFIGALNMKPSLFGVRGPGFLNQLPTLHEYAALNVEIYRG